MQNHTTDNTTSSGNGPDTPQESANGSPKQVETATARTRSKPSGRRRQRSMLIRYGKMGLLGQFRHSEREIPAGITHVVIKTERGMEIGEIISPFCHSQGFCTIDSEKIDQYCKASGPDYPTSRHGTIVRFATEADLKDQQHIDANANEKLRFCRELIKQLDVPMHLVDAEHLFGGERMIFYFMSDGRVDFRDLVKELAHQYQTRIEMRQVGARDEARLIADYETCGRECCCKSFLKVLRPVNMRMAKLQKATLDPAKISGRCGRLKCCLRYEDQVYTELQKNLPRRNSRVLTEHGDGVVVETQVLTQLVKVRLEATGKIIAINIDEILQRNYKPDETGKPAETGSRVETRKTAEQSKAAQRLKIAERLKTVEQPRLGTDRDLASAESGRGKPQSERSGTVVSPDVVQETGSAQSSNTDSEEATPRKRRRRRRKKKKTL